MNESHLAFLVTLLGLAVFVVLVLWAVYTEASTLADSLRSIAP